MMENSTEASSELVNWFISFCGIPMDRAKTLGKTLDEQWINSIEALQQNISDTPNFMDDLGLPKPIQVVIKNKLNSYSNRDIKDLTTRQVQHLLEQLFSEENYGLQFRQNKINGIVLKFADGPDKLIEWGINSRNHADALWLSLQTWKQSGVPLNQLPPDHTESASTETAFTLNNHKPINTLKRTNESQLDHESAVSKKSKTVSSNISESDTSFKEKLISSNNEEQERVSPVKKGKLQRELAALLKTSPSSQVKKEKKEEDVSSTLWIENSHRKSVTMKENSGVTTDTPTLPADEKESLSAPPSSQIEAKPKKKDTKKPTKKASSSGTEEDGGGGSAEGVTLYSRMRNHVTQLDSEEVEVQVTALKELSKQAADKPMTVGCLRQAGALDKLLDMLNNPTALHEMVLWKNLVALNNIIARADFVHVKYLVDHQVIDRVVPLITAPTVRVRLQALWIIGNLSVSADKGSATADFKDMIVNEELIEIILESYDTVKKLKGSKVSDNVCQRYAETIKQLSCDRTREQFHILHKLLPVLRDIIDVENDSEAIRDACDAFEHLIDATHSDTIDALINADILPSLVNRLGDPKVTISVHCLQLLRVFAECSTSQQVLEMENAISHLGRIIVGTSSHKPNKRLIVPATQCLIPICEGGQQSIQQLLDYAPDLYPNLIERVNSFHTTITTTTLRQSNDDINIARNSCLSLIFSVITSSDSQLDYFISLGVYSILFQLLQDWNEDLNIVKLIIKALSNILYKIENVQDIQFKEEQIYSNYNAEKGWKIIKRLFSQMTPRKGQRTALTEEKDRIVLLEAKILRKAEKLLSTAVRMELTTTSGSGSGNNVGEQEQEEEG